MNVEMAPKAIIRYFFILGKTHRLVDSLLNYKQCFSTPITAIHCFIKHMQADYEKLQAESNIPVQFYRQLPNEDWRPERHSVVVFDDFQGEDCAIIGQYFVRLSHHYEIITFYLIQNLFDKGKINRTVSLNSQYMVLFSNPRTAEQLSILSRQMYPGSKHFLAKVYKKLSADKYPFILLDLSTQCPDNFRVRSTIIPSTQTRVFTPR